MAKVNHSKKKASIPEIEDPYAQLSRAVDLVAKAAKAARIAAAMARQNVEKLKEIFDRKEAAKKAVVKNCDSCKHKKECWFNEISKRDFKLCGSLSENNNLSQAAFTSSGSAVAIPEASMWWRANLASFIDGPRFTIDQVYDDYDYTREVLPDIEVYHERRINSLQSFLNHNNN